MRAPLGWPLDFLAVHGGAELEVLPFVAGEPRPDGPAVATLVLYAGVREEELGEFRSQGALCVPARRLLELLAPGDAAFAFAGARELGGQYVRAAARLRFPGEVLGQVAAVLPESEAPLRAFMRRALAEIAVASLGGARPQPSATPRARAAIPGGEGTNPVRRGRARAAAEARAWPALSPPELLLQLFARVYAWRRAHGALPFEPRAGQEEMAQAVLEALAAGQPLAVEAGTGVGKTLAYVLPMLALVITHGRRFIISTHTRNLQQQLVDRDLPELWRCFDLEAMPRPDGHGNGLRFAKLLGRTNYLCRPALQRAMRAAAASGGDFALAQLLLATSQEPSGELDVIAPWLDARLRRVVQSRRESCERRACTSGTPCAVFAARDTVRQADLMVVNHALLFSDAATDSGILGGADGIVLDEAHHIEAVATEHLSIRIRRAAAEVFTTPLGRVLAAIPNSPTLAAAMPRFTALGSTAAALRVQLPALFAALAAELPRAGVRQGKQAYEDGDEVFASVQPALGELRRGLESLSEGAAALRSECSPLAEDDAAQEAAEDLELVGALARETAAALEFLTTGGGEDYAHWLDFGPEGGALQEIAASPLDVGPAVQRLLGQVAPVAVYTSATLAQGGDFGYFMQRAGIEPHAAGLVVPSPFDYEKQCLVVQGQFLGEHDDPGFAPQAAELLSAIVRRCGRRTLVLLTSYAALRRLHAELTRRLGARAPVFAQEISGGRAQLAARFAATPSAVLLGTASFWEGIDFPGSALEILAIAKLPFLVPEEPLVAARCARLRRHGEDPFTGYVLPEAVLRFKQGFGRLVRSGSDRGVVLLLDSRLGERGYGAEFLAALPVAPEVFDTAAALVDRVAGWLEEHGTR